MTWARMWAAASIVSLVMSCFAWGRLGTVTAEAAAAKHDAEWNRKMFEVSMATLERANRNAQACVDSFQTCVDKLLHCQGEAL